MKLILTFLVFLASSDIVYAGSSGGIAGAQRPTVCTDSSTKNELWRIYEGASKLSVDNSNDPDGFTVDVENGQVYFDEGGLLSFDEIIESTGGE